MVTNFRITLLSLLCFSTQACIVKPNSVGTEEAISIEGSNNTQNKFSVVRECFKDSCTFSRILNNQKKEIISFDINRASEVQRLDSNLYYFYLSCGNTCGYGHYLTIDEIFVTQNNEILFDQKKKCIIYVDLTKKRIYSHNLNYPSSQSNLLYDFAKDYRYINNVDNLREIFSMGNLHDLFKKDAIIDASDTLHLYLLGKEENLLNLKVENACVANDN